MEHGRIVERESRAEGPRQEAGGGEVPAPGVRLEDFRERSLKRGVNPVVYWTLRAMLVPFFLLYFRMQRLGISRSNKDPAPAQSSNNVATDFPLDRQ